LTILGASLFAVLGSTIQIASNFSLTNVGGTEISSSPGPTTQITTSNADALGLSPSTQSSLSTTSLGFSHEIGSRQDAPTTPTSGVQLLVIPRGDQDGTVVVKNWQAHAAMFNSPTFLRIYWTSHLSGRNGTSASPYFTFTSMDYISCVPGVAAAATASFCAMQASYTASNPAEEEDTSYTSLATTSTAVQGMPPVASGGLTNPTPPIITGGGGGGNVTGTGPTSSAAAATSSRLSTGAIVGIAVGCGFAALLVVAILVCLLLRKHRRRQQAVTPDPYGHQNNRTQELIAEKEANSGVHETPHSPYSDDGMHGNEAFRAAMGGAATYGASTSQSVPSEHGNFEQTGSHAQSSDPRSSAQMGTAARGIESSPQAIIEDHQRHSVAQSSTPRATSGRYAHLIEEGMTEDDIRRMEEEERHLDAAIEQAVRPR